MYVYNMSWLSDYICSVHAYVSNVITDGSLEDIVSFDVTESVEEVNAVEVFYLKRSLMLSGC